jgi:hypothetical protein
MQRELKASPFKVAASSRNPMNWEPKLTSFFIKGCRKVDKKKYSSKKYKIFRVKQKKATTRKRKLTSSRRGIDMLLVTSSCLLAAPVLAFSASVLGG